MADTSQREFVLRQLRLARARARLAVSDIEFVGISLKCGMIDTQTAIDWLGEAGALGYVADLDRL